MPVRSSASVAVARGCAQNAWPATKATTARLYEPRCAGAASSQSFPRVEPDTDHNVRQSSLPRAQCDRAMHQSAQAVEARSYEIRSSKDAFCESATLKTRPKACRQLRRCDPHRKMKTYTLLDCNGTPYEQVIDLAVFARTQTGTKVGASSRLPVVASPAELMPYYPR
jgi:hypothetical protein